MALKLDSRVHCAVWDIMSHAALFYRRDTSENIIHIICIFKKNAYLCDVI